MCGIVGHISAQPLNFQMEGAISALVHRGPDHHGSLTETVGRHTVQLGHTRLSIIDLSSAGRQPMHFGGYTIVFNGEVYNYRELRRQYLSGEHFASATDTEVVLRLYQRFGTAMLPWLNGDYAMAILDRPAGMLHLIRDRLGVKPLYLHRTQNALAFGSEIKAFKGAGLGLTPNESAIGNWLVFKYSPMQTTLYKEVSRLAPGHILSIDLQSGNEQLNCYWNLSENMVPFKGSYRDACEQLRQHIERAVRLRLVADVPISNYLSGGLDSSIIAHYLRGGNHTHYCAVKHADDLKREGTSSDGDYARRLASDWNLRLEEIAIGSTTLSPAHLASAAWACDDPIADGSVIPAMLIAEKAALHHRVVLSGMGADEIFLGYNGHILARLSTYAQSIPGLQKLLIPILRSVAAGRGPFKAYRRYLQKWGNNLGRDYQAGRYSIVGDLDTAVALFKGPANYAEVFENYFHKGGDIWQGLLNFETDNFLVKNLHYLDRSSMACGLESRVPYLDHELVEFAAGLPVHFKIDWKLITKKILKDAYAGILPAYIMNRRKAGFGMPLRSLMANTQTIDLLVPELFAEGLGCIHMDVLRRIKQEHTSGLRDHSALLYALAILKYSEVAKVEEGISRI